MNRLILPLLLAPFCLFADGGLPTDPYIYVEGKAEVEKPADLVTLSFELSAMQPEQAVANKLVQAQTNKVFALLRTSGIADKDVIASDLASAAEYERDETGQRRGRLLGYRVTRPVQVKVREIAKFPKLIDDLLAIKPHEFSGIQEGVADEKQLKDEVWEKAVANARDRAEKTAKAAGMQIVSVFAISPVAFPQIHPSIFGSSNNYPEAVGESRASAEKPEPSQYRLAPVSVSQSVHVIFHIKPVE